MPEILIVITVKNDCNILPTGGHETVIDQVIDASEVIGEEGRSC